MFIGERVHLERGNNNTNNNSNARLAFNAHCVPGMGKLLSARSVLRTHVGVRLLSSSLDKRGNRLSGPSGAGF